MYTVQGGVKGKSVGEYLQIRTPIDPVRQITEWYETSKRVLEGKRAQWLEFYRLYAGYVDPSKKIKGRANFFFHQIFPQIELEASRYLSSYFTHNPYVQVLPARAQFSDAAKAREQVLQYYYEHAPTHFYETYRFIKYTLLYGCAFRVPTWRKTIGNITKRVPTGNGQYIEARYQDVIYDGLHFSTYSPQEVFPHPYSRSINEMPWLVIEEFVHIDELVNRARMGAFDMDAVNKIPLNCDGQDQMAFVRAANTTGEASPDQDPYMIRLLHAYTPDRFMTSANSAVAVRDTDNYFYHRRIPAIMGVKTLDPERLHPIGSVKNIASNQKMMNFTVNHMINQMVRNMDPVWWRNGKVDPRYLISRPNHVILAEKGPGAGGDFGIVEMPEMKHDLLVFKDILSQNREETTGYYNTQKGYASGRQTATSDSIFEAQGDKRINADVMAFEELSLIPEAKQCSSLIDQFMPDEIAVRVGGPKGNDFVRQTPADIQGEFDFRVGGITENINRAVQQRQMIELLSVSKDMQQLVQMPTGQLIPMPVLNVYEALQAVWEPTSGASTDKILLPPELFGLPIDNQLFQQYGLPEIPGMNGMGGGPMVPRRALGMARGRSVNPGQIVSQEVTGANKPIAGVA